nr:hypothetical protein [Rhizobium gallicum]
MDLGQCRANDKYYGEEPVERDDLDNPMREKLARPHRFPGGNRPHNEAADDEKQIDASRERCLLVNLGQ